MNEKGNALATVLLLSLLLMILLVPLISITIKEIEISLNDQYALQAFYLAEAGTEIGVSYLYEEPSFRGELLGRGFYEKPLKLKNGQINSIKIITDNDNIKITSEGEVKSITRKITVTVKVFIIEEDLMQKVFIDKLDWQYDF